MKAAKNPATLYRVKNLPSDESVYQIRMHDTDTGATVYRSRDGRWSLHDPSRPYGNVTQWARLADVRYDIGRMASQFVFHATGNGLLRLSDGYRPRDMTEALVLSGRVPA